MNFINRLGKLFTGGSQQSMNTINPPSKLKGKMVKDYSFQNRIIQFQNPQTELVSGGKQDGTRVSIYALQKSLLNPESFIAYQNSLANNYTGVYPQYIEHIQSASFIYIVLEQLFLPESKSWMAQDLLSQIQQLSLKTKQKLNLNGLLVNKNKKIVYLPAYQDIKCISKVYYDGINKTVFAELFCKIFQLPENHRKKVYDKIVEFSGTKQLKSEVLKLLSISQKNQSKSQNIVIDHPKFEPYQQNSFHKTKFNEPTQPFHNNKNIKPSQINPKNEQTLYPDISAEDEQIMKLISVVKVNPKLFQNDSISNIRASTRARHQDQQQTKQIKNVIDNTKHSMFDISKVVKKSSMKSTFENKYEKQISNNQFEVYCTTYISIFQHFKRTVKSSLTFYSKGFSGIINAYFITLIGILRRSQLVYALNHRKDIFEIGCESVNVAFYTSKLKKELVSQAKILTDLRQMIMRCYIPINTLEILQPFMDDRIDKIDPAKLEDFTFFYMTSLMKNSFQKDIHFINAIECMYIILHKNLQIVHFESDMPRKWDQDFFNMRKYLIQAMIPSWNID